MNNEPRFSVRVYGIVIENGELLVSEEKWRGVVMQKFPGGGVEYGESPIEALHREFIEEMQAKISKYELLYVSESPVKSIFFENIQVISIYYKVEIQSKPSISPLPIGSNNFIESEQRFHWLPIELLIPEKFTFKSDEEVAYLLQNQKENKSVFNPD